MNILVYSPEPVEASDVGLEPGRHQLVRLVGEQGEMVRRLAAQQPDLVILAGFDPAGPGYIREVEKLCIALPHTAIVAQHPHVEPDLLLALMRAGVREVIADSASETLRQVVGRVCLRTNGSGRSRCRVVGLVSAKGGDGSSCLAANLAFSLAEDQGAHVLAIDLLSSPFSADALEPQSFRADCW